MRLPRRAAAPAKRAVLTYLLIALILLAFGWEMWGFSTQGKGWLEGSFSTYGFSLRAIQEGRWWTPVTSVFLHANLSHILLNVLALFFFGRAVELELGWKRWLIIFWAGAVAGDLAVVGASASGIMPAGVPTIGASAAIFGLMGGAMLARPLELVLYPYIVPVPILLVAAIYVTYNIAAFISVLLTGAETNIAYAAHLGGLAAGTYIAFRWVERRKGVLVLLALFAALLAVPIAWALLQQLQVFSYVSAIGGSGGR